MFSQHGNIVRGVLLGACVAAATVLVGCARPQGVLFPTIDPPRVWPAPPDTPRVKLIGTLSDSRDLKAAQSGTEILGAVLRGRRPPIRLSGPHAVAVGHGTQLAIADAAGGAVHLIDLTRRTHVMVTGFGNERFATPVAVAWVGDRLFVTDAQRHEVIELDADGRFRSRFGGDVLKRPVGVAYVEPRGQLYVVDGDAHNLAVFDLSGNLVRTIGSRGNGPGEFNFPTHLCHAGGRLLVADTGNFRVQLLDLDGDPLQSIGRKGDGAGDFALPKGVAFDSDGHIYVVDAQFENVQVFDGQGRLLMAFGEEGRGLGEFWLPAGLAIDEQDRIWVADAGNRRIQLFKYLRASS